MPCSGHSARLRRAPPPGCRTTLNSPVGRSGRELFALHLELFTSRRASDKLKYLAGSESAMDAFASDVMPEAAAERLRAVGP